jgi:hypothetical protein
MKAIGRDDIMATPSKRNWTNRATSTTIVIDNTLATKGQGKLARLGCGYAH